jgi:hypothetical protein
MWPFSKKPTSLSLEQLIDVVVPGVLEMSKDPNNTLHFLAIENSQLNEWKKYIKVKLTNVAELDTFADQAIALREIVLDALDSRFNLFPYVDNNRTSEEKIILAEKLLLKQDTSDVKAEIVNAIMMFAFSEATVIGTFEASKLIEGHDQAIQWFKIYIEACKSVTDHIVDTLLQKPSTDPLEIIQSVVMEAQNTHKQNIRKEILTMI